jgi:hypothetical protein
MMEHALWFAVGREVRLVKSGGESAAEVGAPSLARELESTHACGWKGLHPSPRRYDGRVHLRLREILTSKRGMVDKAFCELL